MDKAADTFRRRFRDARDTARLSQSEIARQLNVRPQSVSQWERGANYPRWGKIQQLASILGVSPQWLSGRDADDLTQQMSVLEGIIVGVSKHATKNNIKLKPEQQARIVSILFSSYLDKGEVPTAQDMVRLLEIRK